MDHKNNEIQKDGFLFHFFHFLWYKDPIMGVVPSLNVPDTILFQNGKPKIWYFVKERCLKRKSAVKLTYDNIELTFTKKIPKCNIVAIFIRQTKISGEKEKLSHEYFTKEKLIEFLHKDKDLSKNGILQRFIQPKSNHNFIIRVIWAPNLCLFEKTENLNDLNDTSMDIYQRVVTLEVQSLPTRTVPLRGYVIPQLLENISYNIIKHVENVSYESIKINRIVINFKIDQENKVWLLGCSSLRLNKDLLPFQKTHSNLTPVYEPKNLIIEIPKKIEKFGLALSNSPSLIKNLKCLNCSKLVHRSSIYRIKFKNIIEAWELDHFDQNEDKMLNEYRGKKNDSNKTEIPPEKNEKNGEKSKRTLNEGFSLEKNGTKSKFSLRRKSNITISKTNKTDEIYLIKSHVAQSQIGIIYGKLFDCENEEEWTLEEDKEQDQGLIEIKKNYCIPDIILRLNPYLKAKEYEKLKKNPGFLNKMALVCEDCFLEIIENCKENRNYTKLAVSQRKEEPFFGKRSLDPEGITYRFHETRKKIISRESNYSNKTSLPTSRPNLKSRSSEGDLNFASRLIFSQNSAREKKNQNSEINENDYDLEKNKIKINKNFLAKAFHSSSDQKEINKKHPNLNQNVKSYNNDDNKERACDEYGLGGDELWNRPIIKKKKFLDLMQKKYVTDSSEKAKEHSFINFRKKNKCINQN